MIVKVAYYEQCWYISKIMQIIMLVLVNYAHFSRKCRNYASFFYFKFGKGTSMTIQKKQVNGKYFNFNTSRKSIIHRLTKGYKHFKN